MHRYSTFVNWELWWPQFPILVYFKETQTKPEGQIHFFPVIFVSTNLAFKSKKIFVSQYHGVQHNVMSRMANNSMMSWWSALGPQRRAALSSAELLIFPQDDELSSMAFCGISWRSRRQRLHAFFNLPDVRSSYSSMHHLQDGMNGWFIS